VDGEWEFNMPNTQFARKIWEEDHAALQIPLGYSLRQNRATKGNPLNDSDRFVLIVSQIVRRPIS
jgi:hypothetical protein